MSNFPVVDKQRLPQHVAIIMDGNGRWAKLHGSDRIFGHQNGVNAVKAVAEASAELGIKFLTLYAFSTENWARPQEEVNALMELLVETIGNEMQTLMKNNIRLNAIGEIKSLPSKCFKELNEAIRETENNSGLTLILALNYSSRWELVEAAKKLATDVQTGELLPDSINEKTLSGCLQTNSYPDPELMIRTSGEHRLSNFLLWQSAYTELYFTPVLWPDFSKEDFYDALIDYQKRERRFGKTSEQIEMK